MQNILKKIQIIAVLAAVHFLGCSINSTTDYYYKVTLRSAQWGTVCNAGDYICQYNDTLVLTLCSVEKGYRFKAWAIDSSAGRLLVSDKYNDTAIITNIRGSCVISPEIVRDSYQLQQISDTPGVGSKSQIFDIPAEKKTKIPVITLPYDTSKLSFSHWVIISGKGEILNDSIILYTDCLIKPIFINKNYTFNVVQPSEGGTIASSPASGIASVPGTLITFTATPFTGWKVKSWSGGTITPKDDTHATATLTGATTYSVEFEREIYSLTIVGPSDGKITDSVGNVMSGTYSFPFGFIVKVNVVADTGYQFSSWVGTTGDVSTTITMNDNKEINVIFKAISPVPYVKYVWKGANGAGNGSSWADAYTDLNTVLKQVTLSGTEIWVARGEYFRESGPTSYFSPNAGIKLYGGCSGFEKSISERNARLFYENTTILNGAAMDALVYISAADVLLNGFVLKNAQYGVYVDGSGNAVIENCVLRNFSESAAYFSGTCESPIIRKSVFHTNKKASGTDYKTGKAIHIGETVTNALIENCIIINNDGPAISDDRNTTTSLSTIKNCTVIYNANKGSYSGGIYIKNRLKLLSSVVYFNTNSSSSGMQMTNAIGTTEYNDIQEYNSTKGISGSTTGIANCYLDDPGFSYVSSTPLPIDAAWYQKTDNLPFIPGMAIRELVPYTDIVQDIRESARSAPIDIGAYEEGD